MSKRRESAVRKTSSQSLAGRVEPHVITYPISPRYVQNWTPAMGLREVIANALDEDRRPRVEWKDGALVVEDKGPGIPEEGLILGISNKTDQQIGTWGEGLQLATLVLARSRAIGRVEVESVGYTLVPKLTKAPLLKTNGGEQSQHQLMSYEITPNARTRGTKVTIECKQDLAEEAISYFLHLHDRHYRAPESPGRVLTNVPGGRVYVGGLLVQEKKGLRYSYDVALSESKRWGIQNRDRTTIDHYHLERLVQQILLEVDDPDILQPIVEAALAGKLTKLERAFNTYQVSPGYRKAMKAVGKRLFGDEQICYKAQGGYSYAGRGEWEDWEEEFETEDEMLLELRDKGYRILEPKMDYHEFERLMKLLGVHSAGELYKKPKLRKKHKEQKTLWMQVEDLDEERLKNFERAVAVVRAMWGRNAIGEVQPYKKTTDEQADDWGLYLPQTGKIGIHMDSLKTFKDALETLTHEAAHRLRHKFSRYGGRYDYGDRTRGFEDQLVQMAAAAAKRLSEAGLLPETLEELEAHEATQAPHPTDLAAALYRRRMEERGLKTFTALAEEAGVTVGAVKTVVKGTDTRGALSIPKPQTTQAICEALGLDWLPLFVATSCCNAMCSHTRRRSNNWLYGRSYVYTINATEQLRARGGRFADLADVVDTHARGEVETKKDDESWLGAYRELAQMEIDRVEAEADAEESLRTKFEAEVLGVS